MINIGSDAIKAIKELRGVRDFDEFVAAIGVVAQTKVFEAAKAPPDQRVDQTSYARGMYELWVAMHAAHNDLLPVQVKPPRVASRAPAHAE